MTGSDRNCVQGPTLQNKFCRKLLKVGGILLRELIRTYVPMHIPREQLAIFDSIYLNKANMI